MLRRKKEQISGEVHFPLSSSAAATVTSAVVSSTAASAAASTASPYNSTTSNSRSAHSRTTRSSNPISRNSNSNNRNPLAAIMRIRDSDTDIGRYVLKRVRIFNKYSNLPQLRHVREIDWKDVAGNRPLLGKGAFSNVYRIQLLNSCCAAAAAGTEGDEEIDSDDERKPKAKLKSTNDDGGNPNSIYALKRLNSVMPAHDKKFKTGASDLALEVKLLECLDHPNIITLHGVKSGDLEDSINHRDYFLVIDYLVASLDDRLRKWRKESNSLVSKINKRISKKRLLERLESTALGVAKGMEYLHGKNIVFRDLKPDNVGFDVDNTIKIFDFGLARDMGCVARSGEVLGFTGTPRYMANEIGEGRRYGLKVDVYSFGVLLWQIITLKDPFDDMFHIKQYHQWIVEEGRRPDLRLIKKDVLRDLIAQCWCPTPELRPSFPEIRLRLQDFLAEHMDSKSNRNSSSSINHASSSSHQHSSVVSSVRASNKSNVGGNNDDNSNNTRRSNSNNNNNGEQSGSFSFWGSSTQLTDAASSRGSSLFDISRGTSRSASIRKL